MSGPKGWAEGRPPGEGGQGGQASPAVRAAGATDFLVGSLRDARCVAAATPRQGRARGESVVGGLEGPWEGAPAAQEAPIPPAAAESPVNPLPVDLQSPPPDSTSAVLGQAPDDVSLTPIRPTFDLVLPPRIIFAKAKEPCSREPSESEEEGTPAVVVAASPQQRRVSNRTLRALPGSSAKSIKIRLSSAPHIPAQV
jgi:hypothetical protein